MGCIDPNEQLTYLMGGELDEGSFRLEISSEFMNPSDVSALLGVEPTKAWCRTDHNPRLNRPRGWGFWILDSGKRHFRADKGFESQFDDFIRALPDRPDAWNRIAAEHEARVYIVAGMRTWNRDFDISNFALTELARRNLSVHLDVAYYGPEESQMEVPARTKEKTSND